MGIAWTKRPELTAQIVKAWREGKSATVIASIVTRQEGQHVSRNAIIGVLARVGETRRAAGAPRYPKEHANRGENPAKARAKAEAPYVPMRPPPPPAPLEPDIPGGIRYADLGAHQCKWPLGDPRSGGFAACGKRAVGPYCEDHAKLARAPSSKQPKGTADKAFAAMARRWR